MAFKNMVGRTAKFYGVDNHLFKLGTRVFEAVEDKEDGYRSMLDTVEVRDAPDATFFKQPIAEVRVVMVVEKHAFDGYHLVDAKDGHVWLRFGTDRSDGYYPLFVFTYTPKEGGSN